MPEYLAPGVYVEEIQTGNKPIEGVSTSTTGLVGVTERGPVNVPQLVTSYGEYQRMFGGRLPIDEFIDGSGHAHCYLSHAVEGFFINGGKRAYVTRVLPDIATNANRDLFFADPAVTTPGATVLLRPAQQATGTAVNRPLLYVLDPSNFSGGPPSDWIRIGDGSRAEYRQVTSIGSTVQHVTLNFPLHFSHQSGAAIDAGPVVQDTTNYTTNPVFTFVSQSNAGGTEITVSGPDSAVLLGLPGPGGSQLLEIRDAGATSDAAEYAFATAAEDLGSNQVRLTLSTSLRRSYAGGTQAAALEIPTGTSTNLSLAGNGGEFIVYVDTVSGNFVEATPPTATTPRILIVDAGNTEQEVHGIGVLAALPLTVPTYAAYPAGTVGRLVTSVDDDRTVVAPLAVAPFVTITLNDVSGLAIGMTLGFTVAGSPETALVDSIDATAVPPTVTLRTGLSGAPAATSAVAIPPKTLTTDAAVGALSIALDDRLGLSAGDVIRIGTDEIAIVRVVTGERGAPPDAGAVLLEQPLRQAHAASVTEVRRQIITGTTTRQPVYLVLGAQAGAEALLINDGTSYATNEVVEFTLPDGTTVFHRFAANAVATAPLEIELNAALTYGHDAGQPVLERQRLLEVRALDAGAWGNRVMVGCRDEAQGLVSNAQVLAANPPPGPGMFSSLQLSSLTGVEPGTILEVLDPDGEALNLPFLKVRRVDRSNRLALFDPPGLQAAHMTAHNNAQMSGQNLRVRSREFSLVVMLRQRPDPAVPTRNDTLLDQELFRHLSMDPRHSRYVMRIVGATWTLGNVTDDLGIPLRRWDLRSEGPSAYVRVNDLGAPADREAIRLGPEALVDVMPSGLTRIARHPLGELPFTTGDDAVALMNDPMYVGADNSEPTLRTGLYTLKNLQNVSLVAIPGQTGAALQQAVVDHCEEMRYRFAVLDGPAPENDTLTDVQIHRQQYDTKYAALYHPWLMIPDPFPSSLATLRQFPIPPSGHMLGIYARVDNERGVHKAPANEVVRGITGLTRYFTKGEQDILNPYPQNINVIRDFRPSNRALRVWGARCITSDNDYKYVNVRRLLIFLEDSIDRGLQWVVFEPNAEELWARVRRAVTNFLTTVWRNGALEGTTPAEGFFVKCDRTTMTRDDIDNGRLICMIGVAPVKPAEFVIIRIGLWTADAEI
ncbi:MAG: phage tail sheath subtilisin-like domain-containing protein [Nitrospira sp.]|nr:phage tail sheath subtilisin-like domain-containing protein [Nitrospira sp.]